ncbi:MAG TPA: glycosyltransferase family 4 protein [Nitriliruptoraceae bacterium]|nr:glycosyltransferase family 4 protein [Nitriliruptoraceae bacterium]
MTADLVVVTPWYPTVDKPFGGAFVRSMTAAVVPHVDTVRTIHLDEWPLVSGKVAQYAVTDMTRDLMQRGATRRLRDVPDGGELSLPVPVQPRSPYDLAADEASRSLRAVVDPDALPEIVHAHVGLPAGWASHLAFPDDVGLFVTEHATFLHRMTHEARPRRMYRDVAARADRLFAVSTLLAEQLADLFPGARDKIEVVPNAIPFDRFPCRSLQSPTPLARWLYVGSLQARKGVVELVRAFATCHARHDEITLTLLGDGPQREELLALVEELEIADAVHFVDPVAPDEVFPIMLEHDLLTHASRYETFGMTMVEAAATGMALLVTASGGPEESLDGVIDDLGVMVEVSEDPDVIANGYERLRARAGELDVARGRSVLRGRYGTRAIGARLAGAYGVPSVKPDDPTAVDAGDVKGNGVTAAEVAPHEPARGGPVPEILDPEVEQP